MWLIAAAVILGITFCGPIDALADRSFAWHMAQHVSLMFVAAPLVLAGKPVSTLLRALPKQYARAGANVLHSAAVRRLTHPIVAWLVFAATLWITHFSALYQAALEHPAVHLAEHALYLGAALLFWYPLVGGPAHWRPSHPIRMLYVFLAMPQGAFLSAAILSSHYVLYPHYARAGLLDQQNGATVMWVAGGLVMLATFLSTLTAWGVEEMRRDRNEAAA